MDTEYYGSRNPDYARLQRRYKKAVASLQGARDYLRDTQQVDRNGDPVEWHTDIAVGLIDKAITQWNIEEAAERKRLNVGIYQPYGSRGFKRRW